MSTPNKSANWAPHTQDSGIDPLLVDDLVVDLNDETTSTIDEYEVQFWFVITIF